MLLSLFQMCQFKAKHVQAEFNTITLYLALRPSKLIQSQDQVKQSSKAFSLPKHIFQTHSKHNSFQTHLAYKDLGSGDYALESWHLEYYPLTPPAINHQSSPCPSGGRRNLLAFQDGRTTNLLWIPNGQAPDGPHSRHLPHSQLMQDV